MKLKKNKQLKQKIVIQKNNKDYVLTTENNWEKVAVHYNWGEVVPDAIFHQDVGAKIEDVVEVLKTDKVEDKAVSDLVLSAFFYLNDGVDNTNEKVYTIDDGKEEVEEEVIEEVKEEVVEPVVEEKTWTVDGVNAGVEKILKENFKTLEDVLNATNVQLTSIKGIGESTVKKLREAYV